MRVPYNNLQVPKRREGNVRGIDDDTELESSFGPFLGKEVISISLPLSLWMYPFETIVEIKCFSYLAASKQREPTNIP